MANRNTYNVELLPCWHKGSSWDRLAFVFCDRWHIFLGLHFFNLNFCVSMCLNVCIITFLHYCMLSVFKSLYFWHKDRSCDMLSSCDTAGNIFLLPKFSVDAHNMSKISKTRHSCKDSHFHLFFSVIGVRDHYKQKCSFIPGSNTHPCRGVQKGFKFINSYRIQVSSFQRY